MTSKTMEIMQKIIAEKKAKSAAQKSGDRAPGSLGTAQPHRKRNKKSGGLFDR